MADRLQEAFEYVRKTFFPRWDKAGQWKVQEKPDLPSHGKCDSEKKTINLQYISEDQDRLEGLLIHEICHAVTIEGHSKKWLDRMKAAATKAREVGHKELSKALFEEVEEYIEAPKVTARSYYNAIEDCVSYNPEAPYEQVLAAVAYDFGLSPEEVEKAAKRCKQIYKKEVKYMRRYRERKNIFAPN